MNNKLEKLIEQKRKFENAGDYHLIQFDLAHFKTLNLQMAEDGFHPSKEVINFGQSKLLKKFNVNK